MTERDEQLELKKRARRRLVGAAAFALLAIVVLPMVMDEAPPPSGTPVQIRIPGQDEPLPPPTAAKPAATKPAAAPAESAPTSSAADSAAAPAASAAASASDRKPEPAAATSAAAAATPARTEPARPEPARQAARPDAGRADSDRAAAILQGKDVAAQHVVLIGAFANSANVRSLQRKLSELGIKTYTESLESSTGRKTRLRAGPFASREAAEKARDRMKRIGVNGVVAAKS